MHTTTSPSSLFARALPTPLSTSGTSSESPFIQSIREASFGSPDQPLRSAITKLRTLFSQWGGILPRPDASINSAWSSIPNKEVRSSPALVIDESPIYSPALTAWTLSTDYDDDLDFDLEERLRSTTSDPHDFVVYCDPHLEATDPLSAESSLVTSPQEEDASDELVYQVVAAIEGVSDSTTPTSSPAISPAVSAISTIERSSLIYHQTCDSLPLRRVLDGIHDQILVESKIMLDTRGTDAVVSALLDRGIRDAQSAAPVAMVVRTLKKELSSQAYDTGRDFSARLRCHAMNLFQKHWKTVRTAHFGLVID
jgi:hypothetical protein